MIPSTRIQLCRIYNFGGDYIYAKSYSTPKNNKVCDEMAIQLLKNAVKVYGLVFFSLSCAALGPLLKYLITSEKELILPYIIPTIDPNTEEGFYITLTFQIPVYFVIMLGLPIIEVMLSVFRNNVSVAAAVITNSLKEFEEDILKYSAEDSRQFRNIIMKIMDFNRLV